MVATAVQLQKQTKREPNEGIVQTSDKAISWESFEKKYLAREDGFKYEWVEGKVVKTKRTMDFKQFFILTNLLEIFESFKMKGKADGFLISEGDTFFSGNHRRPNIAWFTTEQISQAKKGVSPVPQFVIEVISTQDQINLLEAKMDDYRAAGVQVVWQVFPKFEKIHVYSGEQLKTMSVRQGNEICSAAPALPNFEIAVAAIFKD